jgi:CRP-like cAMP-binding protein
MATDILRRVWLFSQLEQGQLDAISSFTFHKTFAPGELIVEEGHTGNGLYVIVSGNVEVVKALGTDNQRVVATRGSGEVFGEMALLGEWPRTASVRALDQVECLGIDRWVFLAQLERQPQVSIRMLQILAQRLRESDARFEE